MQTLNVFEIICHMSDIHTKILDVWSENGPQQHMKF